MLEFVQDGITFVEVEDKATSNEYDPVITAQVKAGEKAGYTLVGEDDKAVESKLRKYREAARRAGKSARVHSRDTGWVVVKLRDRAIDTAQLEG